ncbi:MAG: ABC transporter permease [Chloroflexota bacterium]|nr:ABC transporter permease [Chloroflexota bacterium]
MNPRLIQYIARRVLLMIPTLFGISVVAFSLMHLAPGSAASAMLGDRATTETVAALERELRLDQPIYRQYLHWAGNVVSGDLGQSYVTHKSVLDLLGERMLVTIEIGVLSLLVALLGSIPLGVMAAVHQNHLRDHTARIVALLGISIPDFWSGILLILVFGVSLGWVPAGGFTPIEDGVLQNLRSLALPVLTLGFVNMGLITRMLRSSMVETLNQNYVLTARALGVPDRRVVWDDALRNAFIPTLTVIGITVGLVLSGSVLLETVFALPGVGRLVADSVFNRDLPVIQGVLLLIGVVYVVVNLIIDVLYTVLDPRIQF